ncbi:MAG TPA: hypothetical protein VIJ93_12840 [bacterium]
MQLTFKNGFEAKANSYSLISLLMKEFLWRETLASNSRLKNWLSAVDKVNVKNWRSWADLTTLVVLKVVTKDFCATLERGLSESERNFLTAEVMEFVEIYGKSPLLVLGF